MVALLATATATVSLAVDLNAQNSFMEVFGSPLSAFVLHSNLISKSLEDGAVQLLHIQEDHVNGHRVFRLVFQMAQANTDNISYSGFMVDANNAFNFSGVLRSAFSENIKDVLALIGINDYSEISAQGYVVENPDVDNNDNHTRLLEDVSNTNAFDEEQAPQTATHVVIGQQSAAPDIVESQEQEQDSEKSQVQQLLIKPLLEVPQVQPIQVAEMPTLHTTITNHTVQEIQSMIQTLEEKVLVIDTNIQMFNENQNIATDQQETNQIYAQSDLNADSDKIDNNSQIVQPIIAKAVNSDVSISDNTSAQNEQDTHHKASNYQSTTGQNADFQTTAAGEKQTEELINNTNPQSQHQIDPTTSILKQSTLRPLVDNMTELKESTPESKGTVLKSEEDSEIELERETLVLLEQLEPQQLEALKEKSEVAMAKIIFGPLVAQDDIAVAETHEQRHVGAEPLLFYRIGDALESRPQPAVEDYSPKQSETHVDNSIAPTPTLTQAANRLLEDLWYYH